MNYVLIALAIAAILYLIGIGIIEYYMDRVIRGYQPHEIEERLTVIRNPLIFRYSLHYYLKNYYRIGKEKWYYEVYYIYCKKVKEEYGKRIYKWDLFSAMYYDWDQANVFLYKIREEKSQIIRESRRKALEVTSRRYFKEDGKILYEK